jgi:hypothetical protein
MSDLSQAQQLAMGWIPHFASADRAIRWGNIEKEHFLWLDEHTLLVGRIDADGWTEDGDFFFADWKSLGPRRRIGEVKAEYRLDPQMLTYGVLTNICKECGMVSEHKMGCGTRSKGGRFMVRWAQKKDPPCYHHEWYSYSEGEIAWWRSMLLNISAKIRADAKSLKPFVTNLTNCLRYGQAYACPFLEPACSKQQWDAVSSDMTLRESHLEIERDWMNSEETLPLILDATRIDIWLGCNERYRREYIDNVKPAPGEALNVGIELHTILHAYYNKLKGEQHG